MLRQSFGNARRDDVVFRRGSGQRVVADNTRFASQGNIGSSTLVALVLQGIPMQEAVERCVAAVESGNVMSLGQKLGAS